MLPTDFKIEQNKPNFNLIGRVKVKVLVVASILAATLITAQMVFANNLATDGNKLSNVSDQITRLERENISLKVEIAQESSLSSLNKKAQDFGFVKPQKVITP